MSTFEGHDAYYALYKRLTDTAAGGLSDCEGLVPVLENISAVASTAELALRTYIGGALSKNAVFKNGSFDTVDLYHLENEDGSWEACVMPAKQLLHACYFMLLEVDPPERTEEMVNVRRTQFVVCLITSSTSSHHHSDYEVFRPELTEYSEHLKLLVRDFVRDSESDAVRTYLEQWLSYCISYVSKCIVVLGSSLPFLIHAVLFGKYIVFPELETPLGKQMCRLFEILGIQNLRVSSVEDPTLSENEQMHLSLSDCEETVVSQTETNKFCQQWAAQLQQNSNKPVVLRLLIEKLKFQVLRLLNRLRKNADVARHCNHSLYRTYDMLCESGNRDVLLNLLRRDSSSDQAVQEVLQVLHTFV